MTGPGTWFQSRRAWLTAGLVGIVLVVGLVQAGNPHSYLSEALSRVSESASGPGVAVTDLNRIDQLQAAFNRDAGDPRLILLFSPT
jgi:hypothetical protein